MSDPIREAFEAWLNNPHVLNRDADNANEYEHPWTRAAWAAWQAAQPKWQPIETAPKDGTSVLLCKATDADGKHIDWRDDMHTAQVFVRVAAWWSGDDAWIVYCSQIAEPRLHFEPTHWMPLPEPPKEAK